MKTDNNASNLGFKTMTPGPTNVRENVRIARSLETTNPDLDMDFYDFYKETCKLLSASIHTKNKAFILGGEGILGLEAACASLTEPKDKVLVIDNGIFGKGFGDFVSLYDGIPTYYEDDYKKAIDLEKLEKFLEKNHDFKYACLVHCDTPSGVLNPVEKICSLLKKYNILTVVDSVAGMYGEKLEVSEDNIDILCGGSQKALSAPPGLTMVWISNRAFEVMSNRKAPIKSYYCNLLLFKDYYKDKWFPYTMPISDIKGLRVALDNFLEREDKIFELHEKIGNATRNTLLKMGLTLYLDSDYSNTVSIFEVPKALTSKDILETIKNKYHVMLAGSYGPLDGKVIRIGHMGENANEEDMANCLEALGKTLKDLGFEIKVDPKKIFLEELNS